MQGPVVTSNNLPPAHDSPKVMWKFPVDGPATVLPYDHALASGKEFDEVECKSMVCINYEDVGSMQVWLVYPCDHDDDDDDALVRNKHFPAVQGDVYISADLTVNKWAYVEPGKYRPDLYPTETKLEDGERVTIEGLPIPPEYMHDVCKTLLTFKYHPSVSIIRIFVVIHHPS